MEAHYLNVNPEASGDRFPQWSLNETKEFLAIRAELDRTFMETKRNKLLWDVISSKLKEKGFNRSADQCKCKWKNLVTRYKVLKILSFSALVAPSSSVSRSTKLIQMHARNWVF